jgi:hypothetical protein
MKTIKEINMFKRFMAFLAVCIMLIPVSTVYADVIAEPNNDFYRRNYENCVHLGRSFYANSPDGYISIKKEPGSKSEVKRIENNEIIYIMFTYNHNGEIWGVTEIWTERINGWIPMEQLLLVYDYISFAEDYQDEFYNYTGDYSELKEHEQIIFWTYPGSGRNDSINLKDFGMNIDENFRISSVYKDEQGREWGFIAYWYARRNFWVCLSEPANADIPANTTNPPTSVWLPDESAYNPDTGVSPVIIAVILVAILVAGTSVLIRVFWKPDKISKN